MAPDHEYQQIEPDSGASGEADLNELDFVSIASTISNYVYENGRRYHAPISNPSDQYILPNDEREQERLDFVHHIFRLSLDGELCFSRLDNPQRILDVGTGTGVWALEMADLYPSAEIIGTDLSPIQTDWAPSNVQFIVDDALQDWAFPEASFDFIHLRTLAGSIPDWEALFRKAYKCLKPGGQIEVSEIRVHFCCDDDSFPEVCHTRRWLVEFNRAAEQAGVDFDPFPLHAERLGRAGFADIEQMQEVVPLGAWPKDKKLKIRGRYFLTQLIGNAFETYSLALFTRAAGWSHEQVYSLIGGVTEELSQNKMHLYTHFAFAVAKKPID